MTKLKTVCKNAKCAHAENTEDLCSIHLKEYEKWLDDMEAWDDWQNRFESAPTDENGQGEVA